LLVDCANGVGALAASRLANNIEGTLKLILENTSINTVGALNNSCGADFVKTNQKLPPSLNGRLKPGQRGCSLDGDADRLIYFYLDERGVFHMLDGDKIAALVAAFIVELVKTSGLENDIKVGVVQTAYANGASSKYLSAVSFQGLSKNYSRSIYSGSLSNVYQPGSSIFIMQRNITT
jgi:phosphoacetylglucosamine mutase